MQLGGIRQIWERRRRQRQRQRRRRRITPISRWADCPWPGAGLLAGHRRLALPDRDGWSGSGRWDGVGDGVCEAW